MSKYKVGDRVEFEEYKFKGIGKIVEVNVGLGGNLYLIELPKEYWGKGHRGNIFCKDEYEFGNYWYIGDKDIECKVEDTMEEVKTKEVKPVKVKEDQFLYKCNTKADGSIAFNKVKMLTLCFVKFNHWGKVYTFINPTGKLLKEGTKVLVDSAGSDNVAYVVGSAKVQKKCVKDLLYAMTGKKGLELKDVLGVYETETREVEVLRKFED